MSDATFRRRYPHLASLMPSPEERAEMDAAANERARRRAEGECEDCGEDCDCEAPDLRPVAFDMPGFANALLKGIVK